MNNKVIDIYKKIFSKKNLKTRYVIVAVCVFFYVIVCIADYIHFNSENRIMFTSSPLRTVLMLIMTLTLCRLGYIMAAAFAVMRSVYVAVLLINGSVHVNLSQLISAISAFVGITALYFVFKKINEYVYPIIEENSKHDVLVKAANDARTKVIESKRIIDRNKKELERLAYYDQLTGLPNRIKMKDDISALIEDKTEFGIIFIGLDNFKAVNEGKGHDIGDNILAETGKRISSALDEGDLLGRLGGDEFIVVTVNHNEIEDCKKYANKINDTFSYSFNAEAGEGVYINVSYGMTFYPADAETVSDLMRNADIALNKAKHDGKNRYVLFNNELKNEINYRNEIAMLLPKALENNEFKLVYQPQFFPNKKLRGFEALIRWNSAQLGFVSPVAFIPVAEETGFILELGEWIMDTACLRLKELTDKFHKNIIMSVNVSSMQFREKDFIRKITKALAKSGADSSMLELEVTESFLLNSLEETSAMLSQLKRMNIKVSIDDFGTGYSSLSYLRQLPLDTLKIDKSFIDVVAEEGNGKSIVNSIIQLAHILGMTVIAEGVEYTEQLDYLKTQTCDCIQGFLFSRPLESEDADAIVMQYGSDLTETPKSRQEQNVKLK